MLKKTAILSCMALITATAFLYGGGEGKYKSPFTRVVGLPKIAKIFDAIEEGDIEMIQGIVDAGADLSAETDEQGRTPYEAAKDTKNDAIMKAIMWGSIDPFKPIYPS